MFDPPNDLSGRVAIVSGASRGIGRVYALALAKAGASVLATARTAEGDPTVPGSLAELKAHAAAEGLTVETQACDIGKIESIEAAVERCVELFGGVDILVNNAVWKVEYMEVLEVPLEDWEGACRINIMAPYYFMRAVIPHMLARGGGSIVNLTTAAAHPTTLGSGPHGMPTYAVTKAAEERLTTYFAAEFAGKGVAVNSLSPGHAQFFMSQGEQPDMDFWGSPMVYLAAQRPADGLTGRILHTYAYRQSWGPIPDSPPVYRKEIQEMLDRYQKEGLKEIGKL